MAGTPSELLHRALPMVRERFAGSCEDLNAFALLLKGEGTEEQALREMWSAQRPQRAIGVCYKKATEQRSHYLQANLAAQFDAWIHVDTTTALDAL